LFLFLLTFQLLIAFSKRQLHLAWFCTHLCITAGLLAVELWFPAFVPYSYDSRQSRFIDVISSFLVILVCMYFVTIYLRNKYNTERRVVEEQAAKILLQNRQLELLNLQKNKLFSVMAHDLRGPFNSIGQVVDMLDNDKLTPEDHALFMGHLKDFTVSTSDMLSNLLSWSYSQLQGMRVNLISLNAKKAVEEVAATQRAFAETKGIALEVDIAGVHQVQADAQMLEIVLRNLINNAIKFTPPGGSIRVRAQVQQHYCVIQVQDTGIGLAPELVNQVFTFNLASTRGTGNEKGLGLGLHLCREFMELQYGTIAVNSRMGEGSTFTISLPLALSGI
jgi:signal transduction histidine kinase